MDITTEEMHDALLRSGYLLEAEVANKLRGMSFFVETNLVIEDPISGKSREIDIAAEYYDWNQPPKEVKAASKVEFVFEIKNNTYPLVLLNEFDFSPRVDDWVGLKDAVTIPDGIIYERVDSYYSPLIENNMGNIYSQYCSFQKKKQNDELMALHPENVHSALAKLVQYCEESAEGWESDDPEENTINYLRHFLYMPVLLIKDDLYELQDGELVKVESSILVVNYHYKKQPTMAYVFVITNSGLESFINNTLKLENDVEEKLIAAMKLNA
ncbi:hypothetical protein ACFL0R_07670 [Pseudomonadota bacterium]